MHRENPDMEMQPRNKESKMKALKNFMLKRGQADLNSNVNEGDENTERGNWTSKTEYLLSMIGFAVGLGNVWRFPYLAYKNGGGAFLIPYVTMLALAGLPLFFLECSLGQFASYGPTAVWRIMPLFKGVGVTMVVLSLFFSIYYNCIIAYSLFYLFSSFQSPLPWTTCQKWWGADEYCTSDVNATRVKNTSQTPGLQYWDKYALRRSADINETGEIVWHLALCLLLAWIVVCAALAKGIKSSGKVVYVTATFPYLVLIVLLIRGVTLEGAGDGISYYIGSQSNLTKLGEAEVWKDATTQIFYSLATAGGGLIALSSYNKFSNNCYLDALIVTITNCGTSVFAGFAIFSVIGHLAHVAGTTVPEVAASGFGLAFIAYPRTLTQLPISPFWSILFFLMLFTLGLDSQFTMIETLTTSLRDEFPEFFKGRHIILTICICSFLFLLGLPCTTRAGIYWINLIDYFSSGWGLLLTAALELIGIMWIYGGNRFIQDVEMMLGKKHWSFWIWWRTSWFVVSPLLILAILFWSLVSFTAPTYGDVLYPQWSVVLGWCIVAFALLWIPIMAIVAMYNARGSILERFVTACRPDPTWGPYLQIHRTGRYAAPIEAPETKKRGLENSGFT